MRRDHVWTIVILLLASTLAAVAQQSVEVTVPPMVSFSGRLTDVNDKPLTGVVGVTFYLYKDQQGSAPLWMETQNVQPDKTGGYSVMLGSTTSHGLPAELFASGEARWLGVQAQGQGEQPRIMLLSVPYAMKAGDAQTIGGLPPSAFVLATPPSANAGRAIAASKAASDTSETSHDVTTTGGTVNTIPLFTTATNVQNSILTQTGTTAVNVGGNLNLLPTTGAFEIGSKLFAFGSLSNANAFLGFAGNTAMTGSANTAIGRYALSSDTIGYENTASGTNALYSNNSGSQNTASGYAALYSNTAGGGNTASGANALYSNNSGSQNTASGSGALAQNSSGNNNTASGWAALYANNGSYNSAFGSGALEGNALESNNGSYNTASGFNALSSNITGDDNTASGFLALFSNTAGTGNTATGGKALYTNTASYNTATGYGALYSNTTGPYNTALGFKALLTNSTGGENTAEGYEALYSNTTGTYNAATGYGALYSNTTGDANTASGTDALYSNTTGEGNTAVGDNALFYNRTGGENTAVGDNALFDGGGNDLTCVGYNCTASDAITNATAIGAHARVEQSNSLVLGGTGARAVKVGIGTTKPSNILTVGRGAGHPVSDSWETYSSRRWKTNIHPLENALSKIEQLRGVSYDLKDSGKHEIGVIAEEVGQVVPEVVSYEKNGKDATGVDYSRLTALLIEAVKQQQKQITAQQKQIALQQGQIRKQQRLTRAQQLEISTQRQLMTTQQKQIAGLSRKVGVLESSLHSQPDKLAMLALK
jgi:hypothetical protein